MFSAADLAEFAALHESGMDASATYQVWTATSSAPGTMQGAWLTTGAAPCKLRPATAREGETVEGGRRDRKAALWAITFSRDTLLPSPDAAPLRFRIQGTTNGAGWTRYVRHIATRDRHSMQTRTLVFAEDTTLTAKPT